ncbi:MAG: ribonuclease domain-containing protein [Tissierellia bacterium]|nr:ribonuclease domain-containing protein [Tissierellia bacterium]
MKKSIKIISIFLILLIMIAGCSYIGTVETDPDIAEDREIAIEDQKDELKADDNDVEKGKSYYQMEEVAKYIKKYDELPDNYITKREARESGWDSQKGNLWDITDMKVIGGDRFGNREKKLPEKEGRKYYECDVNYSGGHRGAERLVYSNDGLIFYTDDHYESFVEIE